jgi:hypothetical protein
MGREGRTDETSQKTCLYLCFRCFREIERQKIKSANQERFHLHIPRKYHRLK